MDKAQAKINGFESDAPETVAYPTVAPASGSGCGTASGSNGSGPGKATVETEVAPTAETVDAPVAGANLRANPGVEGEQD